MAASGQELSARFVLVRRLGAGGSGSVWLAQDNELRHFVAVKIRGFRIELGEIGRASCRERVYACV